MVDIKLIRKNPERYKKAARDKNIDVDIDRLLEVDKLLRRAKQQQQEAAEIKNRKNKLFRV